MPRYALEPSASRKDKRAAQFQSLQEGDQRQQQIDQQGQDGMLQHLAALYGLQQQQQMNPLQMQALQADIQAKGFENQHAPELLASKLGADKAQQAYYGRNNGDITPRDRMQYEQATGQQYIDPSVRAEQAAKSEADKAAARAREEAMMEQPQPQGQSVMGSLKAGPLNTEGRGGGFFDWLYNQVVPSEASKQQFIQQGADSPYNPMNILFGKKKPTTPVAAAPVYTSK